MIEVHDIWKAFGDCEVLEGLSLTVETGETMVILGQSGVGKSVLLKLLIGIEHADRGYIDIDGLRVSELKQEERYQRTKNLGMLFQGAALFDSMNIEENTAFFLNQHGDLRSGETLSGSEIADRVDETLRMVGLDGTQKKMPSDLSGGMRKRAGLARMIVYRPTILLYDEPTTGLDPITAMQINELIVQIQEELQATSLVVTHDIVAALFVADRLSLHKDGKIAYTEGCDEFLKIDDPIIDFLKRTITEDPRSFRRK